MAKRMVLNVHGLIWPEETLWATNAKPQITAQVTSNRIPWDCFMAGSLSRLSRFGNEETVLCYRHE
ncbi:MAG: hypothetical protein LKE28_00850 [Sphaerochaeta sp.]|jgi:hypothetical protein|nr:hypothetical protein [Sphaerochaeta sp.]